MTHCANLCDSGNVVVVVVVGVVVVVASVAPFEIVVVGWGRVED